MQRNTAALDIYTVRHLIQLFKAFDPSPAERSSTPNEVRSPWRERARSPLVTEQQNMQMLKRCVVRNLAAKMRTSNLSGGVLRCGVGAASNVYA